MSNAILKGNASGTGSVTLESPNTNSDRTISLPDSNGTVMVSGNMPAFWAYANALQSVSSATQTLVNFGTKVFDTAGCFNNTGSTVTLNGLSVPAYAFCPNVAGYYQIITTFQPNTSVTRSSANIYKNGAITLSGADITATQLNSVQATGIIYLNGTGDYIQIYGLLIGTSPQIYGSAAASNAAYTLFQAVLVRTA